MAMSDQAAGRLIYTIVCDGKFYIIFNGSEVGNPYRDDPPNGWYYQPYPMADGDDVSQYFATAEEAERAIGEASRVKVG